MSANAWLQQLGVYSTLGHGAAMEHLMIPATMAAAVFLALVGSFCIFKPERMQAWCQRQHNSSNKFFQNYPFAKLIFKPWYPTYLRFMGVWAWMFALFLAYAVFSTLARR
jgi:hypothetical protein